MANNPSGVPGALFDPTPSNPLGGLCTGIGCGTNAAYGPPLISGIGILPGGQVPTARIGFAATDYPKAEAVGFAGYTVALDKATADVTAGGTFPGGGTNQTGKTVLAGSAAFTTLAPTDPGTA